MENKCDNSSYWKVVNNSLLINVTHDDILFRNIFYDINKKRSIILRRLCCDIEINVDRDNYNFIIRIN